MNEMYELLNRKIDVPGWRSLSKTQQQDIEGHLMRNGISLRDVVSFVVSTKKMTVLVYRTSREGNRFIEDGEIATVEVLIPPPLEMGS